MKKKKIWIIITAILGIFLLIFVITKRKETTSNCYPQIVLKGNKIIQLKVGETYQESGYQAKDSCGKNLNKRVQIENHVNYNIPGTYEIIYTVDNEVGNHTKEKRFISISVEKKSQYQDSYEKIDNQTIGWGITNRKDGNRPQEANTLRDKLLTYHAYMIGNDEKKLYLTFDEGQNDTYIKEIVDVLNKNDVKGTFFFCKRYILDNPNLMKLLVKTGHSVGNHTANHPTMPNYANRNNYQKYLNEIYAVEEAFQSVTGVPLDKVYREPKGEYSYRSLQIIKDLGYKTYFWSATYLDFAENVSANKALTEWTSRAHNGAIYLIHPKNKGNYQAMDAFIKKMKADGFSFDLVKNIE